MAASTRRTWPTREIPARLRERYLAEGLWDDRTLGTRVDDALRAHPMSTVDIWSDTRRWHGTFSDLHDEALRLVAGLRSHGVERGDVVAFQMPNWREAVAAFYGLALGGYVLVPIVHIYGPREVGFILGQSGARAYLSTDRFGHVDYVELIDRAAPELAELQLHVVAPSEPEAVPPRSGAIRRVAWGEITAASRDESVDVARSADPDDVCVVAYTSGTTADPKGVMHSHRTLGAELEHIVAWMTPDTPNLMGSPVAHATGMLGAVLGPMTIGQNIHLIDRWDPNRALDVILEAHIGAGTGASVFLASIIDHPDFTPEHAQYLRRIGLGGAPVPVALGERAAAHGIKIIRAYGSTEHPSVTGSSYEDPAAKRHGTDGRAMTGVEIRLCDEDGHEVGIGIPGEIWSRGPDLSVGYTDPAMTKRAFDAEGWYRTGDMGVLDADGFVTITDRLNDVIIRGGANISAAEVEQCLAGLDGVAEVAVVAAPDARLGEHACALLRLLPGAHEPDLSAITTFLETVGLARSKWPESLRIVVDFPRTASGKIRKVELRQMLRDGRL